MSQPNTLAYASWGIFAPVSQGDSVVIKQYNTGISIRRPNIPETIKTQNGIYHKYLTEVFDALLGVRRDEFSKFKITNIVLYTIQQSRKYIDLSLFYPKALQYLNSDTAKMALILATEFPSNHRLEKSDYIEINGLNYSIIDFIFDTHKSTWMILLDVTK